MENDDSAYVLGEVLGTGGMGVVYSAIQKSLGRRVAIKIPLPELAHDPHTARRFRAEARASSCIDHENVARVIDFGSDAGELFLVMQFVAGVPLEKLVFERGPMEAASPQTSARRFSPRSTPPTAPASCTPISRPGMSSSRSSPAMHFARS